MKNKPVSFIARPWNILHNFELKQKKLFLRNLTVGEGQRIFDNLYQFAQKINKGTYKKLDSKSMEALIKVHSIFMKVKA